MHERFTQGVRSVATNTTALLSQAASAFLA